MKRGPILFLSVVLVTFLSMVGCAPKQAPAAMAIEDYLMAIIAKDADRTSTLACAAWEDDAQIELASFAAVSVSLEGLACQVESASAEQATITCQGKIVANYGNEILEINLEDQTYVAAYEGGEWRMCGYQ